MKIVNILAYISLLSSLSYCSENNHELDSYISSSKKEQFNLEYKKVDASSTILRDSWLAPIMLNLSYIKSDPNSVEQSVSSASIGIQQVVFQSGGIYYAIDYADETKIYSTLAVDVSKRALVKNAISILIQVKQLDVSLLKQNLTITNAEINLELKKEQYLSGQLDSGFLDSAIIEKNRVTQLLYDIETSRARAISKLKAISDVSYESATIPHLKLITKDEFLSKNILLNLSEAEIEKNNSFKKMTVAKYLPKVSLVAGYNYENIESQNQMAEMQRDYYRFGIKANMPLNINTFRDIEVTKLELLQSKLAIKDKKVELNALFEQVMFNIENSEKKRVLALANRDIYSKLLKDTKELFQAGQKTKFDVALLENSLTIQELDAEIFELDKQLELLNIYEMYRYEK